MPSADPRVPADPATVVTSPVATMIWRIRWFPESVTNAVVPPGEYEMSVGELNLAAVPVPSADPLVPFEPASVVTPPVGTAIWRITWFH